MKIVIDPGHGMANRRAGVYDPGAVYAEVQEAGLALQFAQAMQSRFLDHGHEVILTRSSTKQAAPLLARGVMADADTDLFLSVHCNAAANVAARGVMALHADNTPSAFFADDLVDAIATSLGFRRRSIEPNQAKFAVLNQSKARLSVLLEVGFLSNDQDRAKMTADGFADQLALVVVAVAEAAL